MKSVMLILMFIFCIIAGQAFAGQDLEFVGGSNIGEFKPNSSELTETMKKQIFNDLASFSRDEMLYVKINSFTDQGGSDELNKELAINRLDSVASILFDIRDNKLEITESFAHVYVPGKNEVNKRFVAIEYFLLKTKDSSDVEFAMRVEDIKKNFSDTVSASVARIKNDLNTQSIQIKDIQGKLEEQGVQISSLASTSKEINKTLKGVKESVDFGFRNTRSFFKIASVAALLFLILISLLFFKFRKVRGQIKTGHEASTKQSEELKRDIKKISVRNLTLDKPKDTEENTRMKVDGVVYSFKYRYTRDAGGTELFYSPFEHLSGDCIYRKSLRQLKTSFKGCMRKDQFAGQKQSLIDSGIIEIIK